MLAVSDSEISQCVQCREIVPAQALNFTELLLSLPFRGRSERGISVLTESMYITFLLPTSASRQNIDRNFFKNNFIELHPLALLIWSLRQQFGLQKGFTLNNFSKFQGLQSSIKAVLGRRSSKEFAQGMNLMQYIHSQMNVNLMPFSNDCKSRNRSFAKLCHLI